MKLWMNLFLQLFSDIMLNVMTECAEFGFELRFMKKATFYAPPSSTFRLGKFPCKLPWAFTISTARKRTSRLDLWKCSLSALINDCVMYIRSLNLSLLLKCICIVQNHSLINTVLRTPQNFQLQFMKILNPHRLLESSFLT